MEKFCQPNYFKVMNILGHNLQCVIHMTEKDNWKGFATWFSIAQFLPKASVFILFDSIEEQPFEYLQWAKRLKLPHCFRHKIRTDALHNRLDGLLQLPLEEDKSLLMLSSFVLVTDDLEGFETPNVLIDNEGMYFRRFQKESLEKLTNDYLLLDKDLPTQQFIYEVQDVENHNLLTIRNGCGSWKNTMPNCPFSYATKFITKDMTENEMKIINLWKEMVVLYNTYN